MGNDVREGDPAHAESVDPLFVIPGVQDDLLSLAAAGGMGPELAVSALEVVPKHPCIHSILGGLVLTDQLEVVGPGQSTWWAQGVVGGSKWDGWLLAWGQEAMSHGNQLPPHV